MRKRAAQNAMPVPRDAGQAGRRCYSLARGQDYPQNLQNLQNRPSAARHLWVLQVLFRGWIGICGRTPTAGCLYATLSKTSRTRVAPLQVGNLVQRTMASLPRGQPSADPPGCDGPHVLPAARRWIRCCTSRESGVPARYADTLPESAAPCFCPMRILSSTCRWKR